MKMGVGLACFPIQTRQSIMAVCTGLFAIVTTDAQRFVDQQNVCRFANTVFDEEARNRRIHVCNVREGALHGFDMRVDVFARRHVDLQPLEERRIAVEQAAERIAVQFDDF